MILGAGHGCAQGAAGKRAFDVQQLVDNVCEAPDAQAIERVWQAKPVAMKRAAHAKGWSK